MWNCPAGAFTGTLGVPVKPFSQDRPRQETERASSDSNSHKFWEKMCQRGDVSTSALREGKLSHRRWALFSSMWEKGAASIRGRKGFRWSLPEPSDYPARGHKGTSRPSFASYALTNCPLSLWKQFQAAAVPLSRGTNWMLFNTRQCHICLSSGQRVAQGKCLEAEVRATGTDPVKSFVFISNANCSVCQVIQALAHQ